MASSSNDPTTGAPIFLDADAPDPAVNPTQVAAFAASVGTRLIGTTAQRTDYDYAREGLRWWDTTLDQEFIHNGSGWVSVFSYDTGWLLITDPGSVLTFGAGWSGYNGAGWTGLRYRVKNGVFYLNGAAAKGSWGVDEAVVNIPVELRPSFQVEGSSVRYRPASNAVCMMGAGSAASALEIHWPVG